MLKSKQRRVYMKRTIFSMLMLLNSGILVWAKDSTYISPVFQEGEELQYKVKWKFIRLGTITFRTLRDSTCEKPTDYKILMNVESNPDISFVWIREYKKSVINASTMMTRRYDGMHRNGDDLFRICQSYNEAERVAVYSCTDVNTGTVLKADTLRNVDPFVEGPSLFFYTRCVSNSRRVVHVPTIVNGKIGNTILDFAGPIQQTEIDALERPVRTREYIGTALWSGTSTAGLSGDFVGWISDDEASVIIKAELNILLGSITVELEKWKRPGWVPPSELRASGADESSQQIP
jgi:hypothetical protein